MVGCNADGPSRDRVMKLIAEKERIEGEIRNLNAVLETNHVGMQEELVDSEGFPRNDIDVYRVRHARHRIICLQNDHKEVMKMIEQGLAEVHSVYLGNSEGLASSTEAPSSSNGNVSHNGDRSEEYETNKPFATISFVENSSPADLAGLCVNDEVLQFGSINENNFRDISQILDIVAHSVGQRISVKVRRTNNVLSLTVVPRPWAQPGLLGCQIRRL